MYSLAKKKWPVSYTNYTYYVMDNILIMTPVQQTKERTKERQLMSQHFLLIGVQNFHCFKKQINVSNPQW
jgi:hypothetical protein